MNNIEILEQLEKMQQTFMEDGLQGYEMAIDTAKNLINRLIQENKELNNKIFQLETDNKKLDKENQGLFEAYNFNDTNLLAKTLKEYRKEILNSILKSKVKEKIDFLKEVLAFAETGRDEKATIQANLLKNIIIEMEKLLEE